MQTITTIGLDIAKSVFQVHGVDAQGGVIIRRQLKRRFVLAFLQKLPPCLFGIEACATWAMARNRDRSAPSGRRSNVRTFITCGVPRSSRWNLGPLPPL
jgi:hypothetical protein